MNTKKTTSSVVAFIPARGGSKGIPKKNIYPINNKPLIQLTLDEIPEGIDKTYVSSDCDEILRFCKIYSSKITPLKRPANLAKDNSTTDQVLKHFIIQELENKSLTPNTTIVLMQPTSPLRNKKHISEALHQFKEHAPNLVLSGYQTTTTPLKSFCKNKDGFLFAISKNKNHPFLPRQQLPNTYFANGAIYIFKIKEFLLENKIPRTRVLLYEMSEKESLDIDSINDIMKLNSILKKKDDEA